jgi:hypothetical protein
MFFVSPEYYLLALRLGWGLPYAVQSTGPFEPQPLGEGMLNSVSLAHSGNGRARRAVRTFRNSTLK